MLKILCFILGYIFIGSIFEKPQKHLNYVFAPPGGGKSTLLTKLASKRLKKRYKVINKLQKKGLSDAEIEEYLLEHTNLNVYSNVPIRGAYEVKVEDLGKKEIKNGILLLDEAGVEMNNREVLDRSIKKEERIFNKDSIKFFKYFRHFNLEIYVFSQSHEDVDVTVRRLATRYYLLGKSLYPFWFYKKRIIKTIGINKETKKIEDIYKFQFFLFGLRYYFGPLYWGKFDSYSVYEIPKTLFPIYK